MPVPLLMTKLYIPTPGKFLVERTRLVKKLDQCLEPGRSLSLISAPAGFGKTTLISAWLTETKVAMPGRWAAWLSIDERDNDPVIFWSYVIAALQTQQEGVGQQALSMLAEQGADFERKLAALINDLAQLAQPCVVVLDDYHLVRNPIIHQSLTFFIEHAPPHIHLMIASRTDPPLPLALLRGRGKLLEIRMQDLRFSDEDAEMYLNAGIGLDLAARSVQALNHKTEGWIAGLQMAGLAMQDIASRETVSFPAKEKVSDFVNSFSGSNRFILDYLIEEVLNRQPEPIQHFLIITSILDQLCGPLCDALLQGSDLAAQSALQYLESCNLFIIPLDQQRFWYRYHQLFADLLRKRLAQTAPEVIGELHRRAIEWYEQNGLIPNAIQHAFQQPDFHKAAALVAQVTEAMWGRGEHATLLAWMDALPDEEKKPYPSLLIFQVSMLISAGKLQEAETCIPILEGYIRASLEANPDQTALIGNVAALRTYIASFHGDRQVLFSQAQLALQNLTRDEDSGQRCGVSLVSGNAFLTEGNLEAASGAFGEAIFAGKKAHKPAMMLTGISNLALVLWLQGDLGQAEQVCREGAQLIEQCGLKRSIMAVDVWLTWGEILCEREALVEAEVNIRKGLELALEQQFVWQVALGYQAQARLRLAQGNLVEAEIAAQASEQWCIEHQVPAHISCRGAGLLAELWLRRGKTTLAERYLQTHQITPGGEVQFPHQSEYLAWARLAWLRGDEGAGDLLGRISDWAGKNRQKGALIAALVLRALVCQSREMLDQGVAFLGRAMELAEPDGYAQCFVGEGEGMVALLREAVRQGIHSEYASRLLAAFPELPLGEESGSQITAAPDLQRSLSPDTMTLVEPLSRREMETLQLIAEGLSNKEIAQKMCISLRTVKYYSTGLYGKLGVDSRMQAVIQARELGLL
jgi:LuxR family transcriptional regulator, maltose regulon positive regulatory protein